MGRVEAALEGRSPSYRNHMLTILRTVCRRGVELGILHSMPDFPETLQSHHVAKSAESSLSPDDVSRLQDHLAGGESWKSQRLHALIAIVLHTGISPVAIVELRVRRDVDLAKNVIWVRHHGGIYRAASRNPSRSPRTETDPLQMAREGRLRMGLPRPAKMRAMEGHGI